MQGLQRLGVGDVGGHEGRHLDHHVQRQLGLQQVLQQGFADDVQRHPAAIGRPAAGQRGQQEVSEPQRAEGEDQRVDESDFEQYKTRDIGPESRPVQDDKKDKKENQEPQISEPVKIGEPEKDTVKKKKGFLNKMFGKKDKKGN